jgi:hypothetical protein
VESATTPGDLIKAGIRSLLSYFLIFKFQTTFFLSRGCSNSKKGNVIYVCVCEREKKEI